jgi:ferredoxin
MRYRIIGRIVYPLFRWGARRSAGGFSVTEACNGCGLCKNLCPVGNIELADARPRWLNRCEQCYACFHWCPQAAVQHGKKTHQQHRYHHPDVTLKQITARTAG